VNGPWQAIILAAGRGPDDPMAKAYGALHKCIISIDGIPMLRRVADTLYAHPAIGSVTVSIDDPSVARKVLGNGTRQFDVIRSEATAASSASAAVEHVGRRFPVLVTTGDHPLLTHAMLDQFLGEAQASGADLCVGLATAETILSQYPEAKRTYLAFGRDRVSGCNLFALMNENSLTALALWSALDQLRKKPWRIVSAFGLIPLLRYLSGTITLQSAFAIASRRLGLNAQPILMVDADASIDVDKPADKELAELILQRRRSITT
jgi:GTP:adenosylcobinamide-phosphate guanylyltransferase